MVSANTAASRVAGILSESGYLLLDGGLATELEGLGVNLDTPLWSAAALNEQPALIREVHLAYLAAGARCISSASYQASEAGFAQAGFSLDVSRNLMQLSVDLALQARDQAAPSALVAASVGPFGASRADGSEYSGDYGLSRSELVEFHRERFQLLRCSGADFLACETIPSLLEAEALVDLFQDEPAAEGWLSFSCRDGAHISDGTPIADCASLCAGVSGIFAIGINCTAPEFAVPLITQVLKAAPDKEVVIYPNAGGHYNAGERSWSQGDNWNAAAAACEWYEAGARLLGGCCRVGPDQIHAMQCGLDEAIGTHTRS